MKLRGLPLPLVLALATAVLASPSPAWARQQSPEAEQRLPDEEEDEFAPLEGLKDADTPMTFKFKDQPLRTIFDVIADMAGLEVTYGDDFPFDRKASLNLPSATLPAALRALARAHGLRYTIREDGGLFVDVR